MTSEAGESSKKPRKRDKRAKSKDSQQGTITPFVTPNEPQESKEKPTLKPKKNPKKKVKTQRDIPITEDNSAEVPVTGIPKPIEE